MSELEPPVIELPRFTDAVRTFVAGDEHTFEQFERTLDRWLTRFTKRRELRDMRSDASTTRA